MQRVTVRNTDAQQIGAANTAPQPIKPTNAYRIIAGSAKLYEGDYEVKPDFDGRTLHTNDRLMLDDVTVHPIEVQRVSNDKGGKTVYIGGII